MRTLILAAFLGLGCHGAPTSAPDGGLPTPVAQTAEEEREAAPAPEAGPPATLRALDGGAPKTARLGGVLLCETHTVWTPPTGFVATRAGTGVVARKGDALVGVQFPPHADTAFATAMGPFVDGSLAWDAVSMKRIDDWHAESTAYGRGRGLVAVVRTLYAGVDPKTGQGRAGRSLASLTADVVWLAVAPTQKEADALLDDARAHDLVLVDHACECGYDCYRRKP